MATYTGKIIRVLQNGDTFVYDPSDDVYAIINLLRGANSGLAELDVNGKVPSAQLPSYVDDVLEYANLSGFPVSGESGKIYVALDTNLAYRWSGSTYVEISQGVTLGTTASTAYRGDHGLVAYNHATDANKLSSATASGFYKVAFTADGHVASVTPVEKTDITNLGIPGNLSLVAAGYDATATYEIGDYCVQSYALRRANVDITIPEAFNATHWDTVTVMDELALKLAPAYAHATDANRLTTAQTTEGLYKITATAEGHIASMTAVAKSDLTGLGVLDADAGVANAGKCLYVGSDGMLTPMPITVWQGGYY